MRKALKIFSVATISLALMGALTTTVVAEQKTGKDQSQAVSVRSETECQNAQIRSIWTEEEVQFRANLP